MNGTSLEQTSKPTNRQTFKPRNVEVETYLNEALINRESCDTCRMWPKQDSICDGGPAVGSSGSSHWPQICRGSQMQHPWSPSMNIRATTLSSSPRSDHQHVMQFPGPLRATGRSGMLFERKLFDFGDFRKFFVLLPISLAFRLCRLPTSLWASLSELGKFPES